MKLDCLIVFLFLVTCCAVVSGQTESSTNPDNDQLQPIAEGELPPLKPLSQGLKDRLKKSEALNPEQTVWLDRNAGKLFIHTEVACNDCPLEMILCPEQVKEHESIARFRGKATTIKLGLMALGLTDGKPVQFSPEFKEPEGTVIDIYLHWADKSGNVTRHRIQSLVRHSVSFYFSEPLAALPKGVKVPFLELRYDPYSKEILWYGQMSPEQKKTLLKLSSDKAYVAAIESFSRKTQPTPMTADFVYTGSYLTEREGLPGRYLAAESGHVICCANFADALIDIKESSSSSDGSQTYKPTPGKLPERNTPMILELVPRRNSSDANPDQK